MDIDAEIVTASPDDVGPLCRSAERLGFDCAWVNETKHDPFVQLALAASSTSRMSIGTAVALAFTRSPTALAYAAWDLQALSRGRLLLGLGSQVRGHVERRFGMKWDEPVPRMKEVVRALRAVWDCWQNGTKLDFQGRFFRLDLMTPFFNPGPVDLPGIPIYLAGVNRGMCRAAGEVADGLHVHPLHTTRYLREVVGPSLSSGLGKRGGIREGFKVAVSAFVAVGDDAEEIRKARSFCRSQVAFYASTRSYRKVMELHGWGDVSDRLHELSMRGEWKKMPDQVPDHVLEEFVTEGTWKDIGGLLRSRYRGLADRVRLYRPFDADERWKALVRGFRA